MTDGRFEATNSIRPNNWDQRRLWCERPQFVKLDPEIRYDESCPFHDLKADGCFQPEYGLIHDNKRATTPGSLTKRPDGGRMKMGGPHPANRMGMGGYLLPLDPAGANVKPIPRKGGPQWNGGGSRGGLFSSPGYAACPSAPPPPPPVAPLAPPPPFTNKISLGAPVPFMPEQRKPQTAPINFRFKAGSVKPRPLAAVLPPVGPKIDKPKRERSPIARHIFKDHKTQQGTFGGPAKHMPTPYHDGPLESRVGGPLFTYAAKSKRTAPIQNTWTTMVQTADPVVGNY